jgi:hypothetical protein
MGTYFFSSTDLFVRYLRILYQLQMLFNVKWNEMKWWEIIMKDTDFRLDGLRKIMKHVCGVPAA